MPRCSTERVALRLIGEGLELLNPNTVDPHAAFEHHARRQSPRHEGFHTYYRSTAAFQERIALNIKGVPYGLDLSCTSHGEQRTDDSFERSNP